MNEKLEKAFRDTTRLLFGAPLSGIDTYSEWLQARIPKGNAFPSNLGGGTAYLPDYSFFSEIPKNRLASVENLPEVSAAKIQAPDEGTSFSALVSSVKKIAWFVPDYSEGTNVDVVESAMPMNSMNMYRTVDVWQSKNISFGFSGMETNNCFGMYRFTGCNFSIHCYNAFNLSSCFEMDHCRGCRDSMFCHNCENVHDSMFCFNAKNLGHAIGNVPLPPAEYKRIKSMALTQIHSELEKTKSLKWDIYNIGCANAP